MLKIDTKSINTTLRCATDTEDKGVVKIKKVY